MFTLYLHNIYIEFTFFVLQTVLGSEVVLICFRKYIEQLLLMLNWCLKMLFEEVRHERKKWFVFVF